MQAEDDASAAEAGMVSCLVGDQQPSGRHTGEPQAEAKDDAPAAEARLRGMAPCRVGDQQPGGRRTGEPRVEAEGGMIC